jgi:hypothetical protein
MWDLWSTVYHWHRFCFEYLGFTSFLWSIHLSQLQLKALLYKTFRRHFSSCFEWIFFSIKHIDLITLCFDCLLFNAILSISCLHLISRLLIILIFPWITCFIRQDVSNAFRLFSFHFIGRSFLPWHSALFLHLSYDRSKLYSLLWHHVSKPPYFLLTYNSRFPRNL